VRGLIGNPKTHLDGRLDDTLSYHCHRVSLSASNSRTAGRGFECPATPAIIARAEGIREMEVKYTPRGPVGLQCRDCKFFEPSRGDPSKGNCFGKDVMAKGTCNMFVAK